jgi:hypothetical protein
VTDNPSFFIPHDTSQGVAGEWLHDGKIGLFTFSVMTQASLDAWKQIFANWQKSLESPEPVYILFDVTSLFTTSPQLWVSSLRIAYGIQHLRGATAFVIADSPMAQLASLLVKQVNLRSTKRQRRLFSDRQTAIEWLETCLAETLA